MGTNELVAIMKRERAKTSVDTIIADISLESFEDYIRES